MTPPRRILGLDIGTRRIGVALSDAMGWTGLPLETVQVSRDGAHYDRIAALCVEHDVEAIVAGLPLNMDGSAGRMVKKVRVVLEEIAKRTGLTVHEWDERLTSVAAERVLLEADVSRRGRKKVIDQLSASLILQGFLAHREHREAQEKKR